jgi:ubiquinone/menaquinone biosynthesis C-methylase UbiE
LAHPYLDRRESLTPEELTRGAAQRIAGQDDLYHLGELRVALDPSSPSHSLPKIYPGEKVLDIGCGAGQTLIAACAYRVPGEGGLCVTCSRNDCPIWGYGIDIDERALKLGAAWSQRMVLRSGRAENIPFGDAEFDVIVSRVALVYSDLPRSAREMRRVLKPGGRLWLTLHPFSMVLRRSKERNWKGQLYRMYFALNGLIFNLTLHSVALFGKHESWQSGFGMKRLLTRNGFTNVQVSRSDRCFLVTAQG